MSWIMASRSRVLPVNFHLSLLCSILMRGVRRRCVLRIPRLDYDLHRWLRDVLVLIDVHGSGSWHWCFIECLTSTLSSIAWMWIPHSRPPSAARPPLHPAPIRIHTAYKPILHSSKHLTSPCTHLTTSFSARAPSRRPTLYLVQLAQQLTQVMVVRGQRRVRWVGRWRGLTLCGRERAQARGVHTGDIVLRRKGRNVDGGGKEKAFRSSSKRCSMALICLRPTALGWSQGKGDHEIGRRSLDPAGGIDNDTP
ncbi:hypothetical protein GLOTRDRAFT_111944 [Gloeophyllum trabeum ATCC 11539]|uniref:Uncharacterized protein n=1 Tax=Gloeophyllum trabeum (strain ATCC 11539 / FP-39264 / Madison 617) TaxID=670483 RepID=S7RGK3_GLOTA|nr:uncharacterized protein GLOTRDRAFT_111944 [Gloeophyllum trabeum ATCC 11539]EPQ53350.1 hypothetical protein GLOTRDRAFT_111944 [Gloeophyllum trabeum ATCC 11539]